MATKRMVGAALLVLGGLASYLGVEALERELARPDRGAALLPFEGVVILFGLAGMVVGGILLARSFLEF